MRLIIALGSLASLLAAGCGSDSSGAGPTGASSTVDGGSQSGLAALQQTLFTPSCATASCHDSTTKQSGLDLSRTATTCSDLVGVAATESGTTGRECTQGGAVAAGLKRVVPGDSTNSFLYLKLSAPAECVAIGGTQAGERMPKDRGTVSSTALAAVKQWIDDGASCD